MKPDEAFTALASAHDGMSEAEIREHACALAKVVASQDELLAALCAHLDQFQGLAVKGVDNLRSLGILVRQVSNLHACGRKAEARRLLKGLAEAVDGYITAPPLRTIDVNLFVAALTAWPGIYSPQGAEPAGTSSVNNGV